MILVAILVAVPVVTVQATGLRPENTVRQLPVQWIPPDLPLKNFESVVENFPALGRWFLNSTIVPFATAFLSAGS